MHDQPADLAILKSDFLKSTLKQISEFLKCFIMGQIGNGLTIRFCHDNWGEGNLKYELPLLFPEMVNRDAIVKNVMMEGFLTNQTIQLVGQIKEEKQTLDLITNRLSVQNINITIEEPDMFKWRPHGEGIFSVNSTYFVLKDGPRTVSTLQFIWKLYVPPRFQIFGWLTANNRFLPTVNLAKRGWQLPSMWVLCRGASELVPHLFDECKFSINLSQKILQHSTSSDQMLQLFLAEATLKETKELTLILCSYCGERCSRIFAGTDKGPTQHEEEVWNLKRWMNASRL